MGHVCLGAGKVLRGFFMLDWDYLLITARFRSRGRSFAGASFPD